MRERMRVLALAAVFALLAGGSFLGADPPDRVGRLNLVSGTVSFHPASVEEWTPATLNYPLTVGDHLWTDQDGQAEIHIGSTAMRLASSTDFEILNLDDQTTQIRLSTGSLNVRVRHLDPDEIVEVDTPNAAATLTRAGSYRIDVQETGDTSVIVRLGEADVAAGNETFSVFARQSADVTGIDSPEYQVDAAPPPDDWDAWCQSRDRREDRVASYVPREMVGAEDLSEYGTWHLVAGYGPVWRPREVVPGWAPYHYGHWAWVDPWGWTWIEDAPWGFAPFHYGRWAFLDSGWVWIPGTAVTRRPVYAPALVVFVGGDGFGTTVVAGGGVGWFPLGPREAYVPPYTVSTTYVRNVNYGHVTVVNVQTINVTQITYVNRVVPGAVTVVPNQAFIRAQPVATSSFMVPQDEMRRAPVRGWTAPLAPVRESVIAQPVPPRGAVAQPPAVFMSRPVVGRRAPPPSPVPFAARQQALQAQPGRPVDPGTLNNLRGAAPPPRGPVVIVNPAVRGPGPGGPRPERGPGPQPSPQPGPQGPRTFAPGTATPRVQPGPQPGQPPGRQPGFQPAQPGGQQGGQPGQPGQPMNRPGLRPGPQPGQGGPRMQPGTPPGQGQGQEQGPQPGQPSDQGGPRMRPGTPPGQQPGFQPGQPVPRQQPGTPPGQREGQKPGVGQGRPGPAMQPGIQRGAQGQPAQGGPKPEVRQQGGPQGGQQGGGGSSDDEKRRRRPGGAQDQGGRPGGPGGPGAPGGN